MSEMKLTGQQFNKTALSVSRKSNEILADFSGQLID